jgi:hypothetical protein
MSPLRLTGSTSGYSQLDAPAIAGDQTFTLPGTGGTFVTTAGTQTLTNKTIQGGAITSGTAVASTSGTAIDFTGLSSWVKRITVMLDEVSLSGSNSLLVQLGTSGGVISTNYSYFTDSWFSSGTIGGSNSTTGSGFLLGDASLSTSVWSGHIVITNISSNIWVASGVFSSALVGSAYMGQTSGRVSLASVLTRVRVAATGADTFTAGTINIFYEG